MKILELTTSQKLFDKILSGEKKTEVRELRPPTERRYVVQNDQQEITDIIPYEAIRYRARQSNDNLLISVAGIKLYEIEDEKKELMYYSYNGVQHQMIDIEYSLGNILEKSVKQ